MELFGFEITRKTETEKGEKVSAPSFVPPVEDDGTPVIQQQIEGMFQVRNMVHMWTWKVVSKMRLTSLEGIVKYH